MCYFKKDLIALPFFPDSASPSWGLNGFKEYDLFYSDKINSKLEKQLTALAVAKEMAHLVNLLIVFSKHIKTNNLK